MSNSNTHTEQPTYMTVEDYLSGCVGYVVPDDAVQRILMDNSVASGTAAADLTIRQKDFLKMGLYEYILLQPSMTASITDSNGAWSHKEGATESNKVDREYLRGQIKAIKQKYGIATGSSIKLHNYGMRPYCNRK